MIQKRPERATRSTRGAKSRKGRGSQKASDCGVTATETETGTGLEDSAEAETEPRAEAELAAEDVLAAETEVSAEPTADGDESGDESGEETILEDGSDDGAAKSKRRAKQPKESIDLDQLALRLEALLFASGQALATRRLSKALDVSAEAVNEGLQLLAKTWSERSSALELVEVSGGWRLMTRAAFHDDVAQLAAKAKHEKLSPAALETLAVVAYRQPIGRADIEAVRGVQCGPLLRVLLDRDLIRIAGRSSEPGHPLLYGTSKRFLDHFGLASLKNLPDVKDLLNVS